MIILLTLTCVIPINSAWCAEQKIPDAPEGYTWKKCEAIRASFLMPTGWFFKEEGKGDTKAYFISKESIDSQGMFKTGFSVNVIKNADLKVEIPLLEYTKQTIEALKLFGEVWGINQAGDGVYLKGYGAYLKSRSEEIGSVVQYQLMLENEKTKTLYIIVFESLESEWSDAWKIGETIINNLALETDY